jgi:hypothetical protein
LVPGQPFPPHLQYLADCWPLGLRRICVREEGFLWGTKVPFDHGIAFQS